jgi:outer membrane protein TolC
MVCLMALPAAAQSNNTVALGPAAQTSSAASPQQPGEPLPNAPEPKKLVQPLHVDYSKPAPLLPNPFDRFAVRDVPAPVFTNTPKLGELVQNGKIMLSLNDAIAIALADNLDLVIARYNLPIADTDILRTKSGAAFLGVANGLVQNTPGGGVGGIGTGVQGAGAGGTSAGAGGAGTGAGGFVGSTAGAGPQPDNFDPILNATFSVEDQNSLTNFGLISGIGNGNLAISHITQGNVAYQQGFSPGTLLTVAFTNVRTSVNSPAVTFNPEVTSAFRATLRQHLLQGFGPNLNTRFIRVAKNNKKITEQSFRLQVMATVSQIENIYWDLVNAYEDYKVKERALALQQKTLSDNKKQVEIGTLAPLDVVRAESAVANAEQDLIISKTTFELDQLTIKNALTRTLPNNSQVMQIDVVPTDTVEIPEQEDLPSTEQLINLALTNRPDYSLQKINLQNSIINQKGVNNQLLPSVDVVAFYAGSGLSGVPNILNPANAGAAQGGFTDSFGNIFSNTAPDKGVAINVQIPLANRFAQSQQVRAQLEYRQAQLLLRQTENLININIRNDVFALVQARARVAAARRAQVLAQQTLDAEQKKYNLGASTYTAVLTDEIALTQAEVNLVSAMTNYAKARVLLDKDTAQTLDRLNIKLDEATTGTITTQPAVPGVVMNKNALQELTNPALTPPPGQQPPPKP